MAAEDPDHDRQHWKKNREVRVTVPLSCPSGAVRAEALYDFNSMRFEPRAAPH